MIKKDFKAWFVTLTGALFFFYIYFQTNFMTALNGSLAKHFQATSSQISFTCAFYFFASLLFIIPAGFLMDRFSIKILMLVNIFLAVTGTVIFAFSTSLFMMGLGRFLSGITMAFGLIICLKLATLWISSYQMALATSLIVIIGVFGGVIAQAPMTMLINLIGWQSSLLIAAALGVIIGIILWLVVCTPFEKKEKLGKKASLIKDLAMAIRQPQNWLCGFFICFLNLPMVIFGALFGIAYLVHTYHFSDMQASSIVSMLFLGMISGSPFFGWLSDFIRRRKIPMYIGSILCLTLVLIFLLFHGFSFFALHLILFFIGFGSSSQILGFPVISENNPDRIKALSLSLAAFIIVAGYVIGLPFVGAVLDIFWDGKIINGQNIYSLKAYQNALIGMPIAIFIAIILMFFIKETYCEPYEGAKY